MSAKKYILFFRMPKPFTNDDIILGVKYKIKSRDDKYYYFEEHFKVAKSLEDRYYVVGKIETGN